MKGKIRSFLSSKLVQSSSIYTVSSIIEKAIPFFLLPILTRYLSTEDYGIVAMFSVLVGLTIPFTGFNTTSAVLRSYFKDKVDFPVYVSSSLLILVFSSSVVLGIYLLFSDQIAKIADFPSDWLVVVVVVATGQFIANLILVVWQAEVKPKQYGMFKVLMTASNMGVAILLIVALGFGWKGKVIGKLFSILMFGLAGIAILWRKGLIKFKLSPKNVKHALKFGIPLIPHAISGTLITSIDRVFVTNMVGISETGIYTVGYQIGMIVMVLAISFNKAWSPWLYERLNEDNFSMKKRIVKFTYLYFMVITFLAFGLALIAPWFMDFFVGENFQGAVEFVIWIALGYAFNGMYFMVSGYIFYEEKTHYLTWLTIVSALTNIVLNYFLITIYGAVGAALATTGTFFVLFILTWILANRIHDMPWLLYSK